jgi:hypothetical protein
MKNFLEMTWASKRLIRTSALLIAALGPFQLYADDCFTMLTLVFTNAKAYGNAGNGQTYATVTKHYAGGNKFGAPDPVRYAFGNVPYAFLWWASSGWSDTVSGTIMDRQNTTTQAYMDMFAPAHPPLSLKLEINASGMVSVQELIGGNPIGGIPPTVYQGACSSGLITVVDHGTSWVFSLTTTPPQWIK